MGGLRSSERLLAGLRVSSSARELSKRYIWKYRSMPNSPIIRRQSVEKLNLNSAHKPKIVQFKDSRKVFPYIYPTISNIIFCSSSQILNNLSKNIRLEIEFAYNS